MDSSALFDAVVASSAKGGAARNNAGERMGMPSGAAAEDSAEDRMVSSFPFSPYSIQVSLMSELYKSKRPGRLPLHLHSRFGSP